ncbi:MAG: 2-dehydropantoate 2-reductase [Pseudomonadales bacterium]|nr:2-dehydropantoate 2-reductase [Pseudomonadales bacterium]
MKSYKNPESTHWHVLGAGAIGCLWASHLSRAGKEVTLLLRTKPATAKREKYHPILLEQNGGISSFIVQIQLCSDKNPPIHNLIVCTKSFDALAAIHSIEHRLAPNARIVLLLNGMGVQQECIKRYPGRAVICGSTSDGAYRRDTFHVIQAGKGQTFFGVLNRTAISEPDNLHTNFMKSLNGIELNVHWSSDMLEHLWRKLAINCAINPLTAINRCRNGELLNDTRLVSLMQDICSEIEMILGALKLPYAKPSLFNQVTQDITVTAQNYSSMYQDLNNARPTEIDQITGFICRQAKALGIPVPTNEMLYRKIKNSIEFRAGQR